MATPIAPFLLLGAGALVLSGNKKKSSPAALVEGGASVEQLQMAQPVSLNCNFLALDEDVANALYPSYYRAQAILRARGVLPFQNEEDWESAATAIAEFIIADTSPHCAQLIPREGQTSDEAPSPAIARYFYLLTAGVASQLMRRGLGPVPEDAVVRSLNMINGLEIPEKVLILPDDGFTKIVGKLGPTVSKILDPEVPVSVHDYSGILYRVVMNPSGGFYGVVPSQADQSVEIYRSPARTDAESARLLALEWIVNNVTGEAGGEPPQEPALPEGPMEGPSQG